mmetsp:Transcript_120098/g.339840  ORF Transcript_120098/g.339840 Transcript_120098/m.339840 type:complete len:264 (+) Transcript_120098:742-1533(+)
MAALVATKPDDATKTPLSEGMREPCAVNDKAAKCASASQTPQLWRRTTVGTTTFSTNHATSLRIRSCKCMIISRTGFVTIQITGPTEIVIPKIAASHMVLTNVKRPPTFWMTLLLASILASSSRVAQSSSPVMGRPNRSAAAWSTASRAGPTGSRLKRSHSLPRSNASSRFWGMGGSTLVTLTMALVQANPGITGNLASISSGRVSSAQVPRTARHGQIAHRNRASARVRLRALQVSAVAMATLSISRHSISKSSPRSKEVRS